MALKKLSNSPNQVTKEIRYLNKSFSEFRQSLIDFSKVYFPNTYNDFNSASPGTMFIELAAYVGDVLSYYMDTQFKENLIQYAEEFDNIISIAQSLGYKPKPSTASSTEIEIYQLCPATTVATGYAPDERYMLRLKENMILTAPQYNTQFRTTQIVNFSDPADREIVVSQVDAFNKPLTYLIRKKIKVLSGRIKTLSQVVGAPQRFTTITLPEDNVLGVIKVEDDNGFVWNEVDFLAQDLVFEDVFNAQPAAEDESVAPVYTLNIRRTPRRFVTRYDADFRLSLQFGSGVTDDSDSLINLEPSKIANDEYQTNLASTSLDPSDFLSSNSYGLSPSNTELVITYVVGGGIESNVPSNSITDITTMEVLNDISQFSPAERGLYQDIVSSLVITNPTAAIGGRGSDSVNEIRENAIAFFNAQNRLVTPEDYVVRCFSMPPKYGGVAKAFVIRDEQINEVLRNTNALAPVGGEFVDDRVSPNVVNLYVLGYNKDKKLTKLNAQVKENLKKYLETYRILTDEIRILDGFVVNIGVNFKVIIYKNFNLNEVMARCIDTIKDFFDIDKWKIGQPIIINDLLTELAGVEGVQSVASLKIYNKYSFKDGADYNDYIYDIDSATQDGIIYPSLDPMCWELRFPNTDIIGAGVQ